MSQPAFSANRRSFLKSALAAAAVTGVPGWFVEETLGSSSPRTKLGPNDRPGIALVGCGGRGMSIIKKAAEFGDVVAVCDVDEAKRNQALKAFPSAQTHVDFRTALDRSDVHVVVNGTPDHWHTLVNLNAVARGLDVYSEKPLTLTIEEGQRLVKAEKKSRRILQTGSQQRSEFNGRFRLAAELVRNGRVGKLRNIIVGLPNTAPQTGPFTAKPVPAGLDWVLWLGQAPQVDYVPERCHFNYRWWYDYSGGMMTDWGAHHLDIAQWAMGLDRSGPVEIAGEPLSHPVASGYTAYARFRVHYLYINGVILECSTETDNGIRFVGDNGWIFVSRSKIEASRPELLTDPLPPGATKLYFSDNHMGNFFDCVRSRRQPICDVEIGHRSASTCHLGVISLRLGRRLIWNPLDEQFIHDAEADRWLRRTQRAPYTYGRFA